MDCKLQDSQHKIQRSIRSETHPLDGPACCSEVPSVTAPSFSSVTGVKPLGVAFGQGHRIRSHRQHAANVRNGRQTKVQRVSEGTSGHSLMVCRTISKPNTIVSNPKPKKTAHNKRWQAWQDVCVAQERGGFVLADRRPEA